MQKYIQYQSKIAKDMKGLVMQILRYPVRSADLWPIFFLELGGFFLYFF